MIFDGETESVSVEEFISKLEHLAQAKQWSVVQVCQELFRRCKGQAWQEINGAFIQDLDETQKYYVLKSQLIARFGLDEHDAWLALKDLKFYPEKDSIDRYATWIRRCVKAIYPEVTENTFFTERIACRAFWGGLEDYPRLVERRADWKRDGGSLAQCVAIVRPLLPRKRDTNSAMIFAFTRENEPSNKTKEDIKIPEVETPDGKRSNKSSYNKKRPYNWDENPEGQNINKGYKRAMQENTQNPRGCDFCGRNNHKVDNCWFKKRNAQQQTTKPKTQAHQ